jgi:hypothetical protein
VSILTSNRLEAIPVVANVSTLEYQQVNVADAANMEIAWHGALEAKVNLQITRGKAGL